MPCPFPPPGGNRLPDSEYNSQKRAAIKDLIKNRKNINKQEWITLTTALRPSLGLDPSSALQLWQVSAGSVDEMSVSYCEELMDIVHDQHRTEIENRFDMLEGMKYLLRVLFTSESTDRVSFNAVKQAVDKNFDEGGDIILQRLKEIEKGGWIDRVDMGDMVEKIESNQMWGEDENTDIRASLPGLSPEEYDIDTNEDYTPERGEQILDRIRAQIELSIEELDKGGNGGINVHVDNAKNMIRLIPQALKHYGSYCRRGNNEYVSLKNNYRSKEEEYSSQGRQTQTELMQANKTIFDLQTEIAQMEHSMQNKINKAVEEAKNRVSKAFENEIRALEQERFEFEDKARHLLEEKKQLEDSRRDLLEINTRLENKLSVATAATQNAKIRKVMEKAYDDQDFYNKIIEAADRVEAAERDMPNSKKEIISEKELAELREKFERYAKNLDEAGDFIQVLQNEIRDLKERQADFDKLGSKLDPFNSSPQRSNIMASAFQPVQSLDIKPIAPPPNYNVSSLGFNPLIIPGTVPQSLSKHTFPIYSNPGSLNAKIANMQIALTNLKAETTSKDAKIATLTEQLITAKLELSILTQRISEMSRPKPSVQVAPAQDIRASAVKDVHFIPDTQKLVSDMFGDGAKNARLRELAKQQVQGLTRGVEPAEAENSVEQCMTTLATLSLAHSKLEDVEKEKVHLTKQIEALQAHLNEVTASSAKYQEDLKRGIEEKEGLAKELTRVHELVAQVQRETSSVKAEKIKISEECQTLHATIQTLEEKLKVVAEEKAKIEEAQTQAKTEESSAKSQWEAEESQSMQPVSSDCHEELAAEIAKNESLRKELDAALIENKKIRPLEEELEASKMEAQKVGLLTAQLAELRAQMEAMVLKHNQETGVTAEGLKKIEAAYATLKLESESAENSWKTRVETLQKELTDEISHYKKESERLEEELKEIKEDKTTVAALEAVKAELEESKKEYDIMRVGFMALQALNGELNNKIEEFEAEQKHLKDEIKRGSEKKEPSTLFKAGSFVNEAKERRKSSIEDNEKQLPPLVTVDSGMFMAPPVYVAPPMMDTDNDTSLAVDALEEFLGQGKSANPFLSNMPVQGKDAVPHFDHSKMPSTRDPHSEKKEPPQSNPTPSQKPYNPSESEIFLQNNLAYLSGTTDKSASNPFIQTLKVQPQQAQPQSNPKPFAELPKPQAAPVQKIVPPQITGSNPYSDVYNKVDDDEDRPHHMPTHAKPPMGAGTHQIDPVIAMAQSKSNPYSLTESSTSTKQQPTQPQQQKSQPAPARIMVTPSPATLNIEPRTKNDSPSAITKNVDFRIQSALNASKRPGKVEINAISRFWFTIRGLY